jgi:hypothetical protein
LRGGDSEFVPAFAAHGASSITGTRWGRNSFGFEAIPSGPQPLRNLRRRPDGSAAGQLVGDCGNPILKQEAAAIVKQKGELAFAGKRFPNRCFQKEDGNITIIYNQDNNVRYIRMNAGIRRLW